MAELEIKDMISDSKLAEIKQKDSKPLFKVFAIGHEGEAKGFMLKVGNIVKKWFQSAIKKLHEKVQMGLKMFHGHGKDNETDNRIPIAEVVGKKLKEIDNKLTSMVACWIYPEFKNLPLDVASIEADILIDENENKEYIVSDVEAVTAIALGNKNVETPGFAGATLLGQLQAFAQDNKISLESGFKISDKIHLGFEIKSGLNKLTLFKD
ncbi:MAG: hypothetical protein ACFFBD_10130 [Candidatus Hodarchaeota archaeon]